MTRAPLLLLVWCVLVLVAGPAVADMYQDGSNAKLPEARNNLELGTVKSEGGDPPEAITRFYTWDKSKIQFQVSASPFADEYAIEQAGQQGKGPTRLCYSNITTNVDCNYVSYGFGKHVFGNGAGSVLQLETSGTGIPKGMARIISGDDALLKIYAESSLVATVGMYLRTQGTNGIGSLAGSNGTIATWETGGASAQNAYLRLIGGSVPSGAPRLLAGSATLADVGLRLLGKGTGTVTLENGNGILARVGSGGAAPTTAWPKLFGVDDDQARVVADSDSLTNVNLTLAAKGNLGVSLVNSDGNLASFVGNGATPGYFVFTVAPSGGGPATLATNTTAGVQVTKLMLASQTVAALPACSATYKYALAAVSDQNGAPTYRGALTGGGALAVMAFCNGASWEAH